MTICLKNNINAKMFNKLLHRYGLQKLITEETNFTTDNTCIDLINTNNKYLVQNTCIHVKFSTIHSLISVDLTFPAHKEYVYGIVTMFYEDCEYLAKIAWNNCLSE
jgi:hypothetical protein